MLAKVPRAAWIALAVALVVAVGAWYLSIRGQADAVGPTVTYSEITAERGNIENTISGSGSVSPVLSYDILALESGEVLYAPYEEGDTVKKGDLLYQLDDSDKQLAIERQQNSVDQTSLTVSDARENLQNATIRAPGSGYVGDLSLEVGDNANGKVATIYNYETAEVTADFYTWQAQKLSVGQSVSLYFGVNYASGTIESIAATPHQNENGESVTEIKISAAVGSAVTSDGTLTVQVPSEGGAVFTSIKASAETPSKSVNTSVSAKVTKLYVKNGDYVNEGDLIMQLDTSSFERSLENSQLSLKSQTLSLQEAEQDLDNFNITAPDDGIVISKSAKVGDTVSAGTGGATLMTIADLSEMVFTISVDELDIASIQVGQKVSVTADALEGVVFDAEVTKISITGTTSGGVTTYPVEVTIRNPEGLKIGMNVSAEIVTESAYDAVTVSAGAVLKQQGMSLVRVGYAEGVTPEQAAAAATTTIDASLLEGLEVGDTFESGGFIFKRIETGVSNGTLVEVLAGLDEGDTILLSSAASTGGNGGMGGGMVMVSAGPDGGGRP